MRNLKNYILGTKREPYHDKELIYVHLNSRNLSFVNRALPEYFIFGRTQKMQVHCQMNEFVVFYTENTYNFIGERKVIRIYWPSFIQSDYIIEAVTIYDNIVIKKYS
jgi:hypothetical protein